LASFVHKCSTKALNHGIVIRSVRCAKEVPGLIDANTDKTGCVTDGRRPKFIFWLGCHNPAPLPRAFSGKGLCRTRYCTYRNCRRMSVQHLVILSLLTMRQCCALAAAPRTQEVREALGAIFRDDHVAESVLHICERSATLPDAAR
jgi:hypothetical protein